MEINKMKAAVVGCGVISNTYIPNLQNKFKIIDLVACSNRSAPKAEQTAAAYQIKALSYEEILNDPSIEMILNFTAPAAHYQITKQALEHGKHVFTEKMIAVELAEGKELLEIAKRNKVRLGAAPDTFLGSSIQTSKYIVEKGLIGTPLSAVVSLNRNSDIFADLLPHMNCKGGTLPFDMGGYYLTALASILGPAKRITAFSKRFNPDRIGKRVDKPWFKEPVHVEADNIMTALVEYESGVLCTVHFNSESIINEQTHLEIYGTDGILLMGDPNGFGSPVYLQKPFAAPVQFPSTHGYSENSRGLGAAEMAWAIRQNRPHRASMEMAYHVFEMVHGMYISSQTQQIYTLQSTFKIPDALPAGYIDNGFWGPTEESALSF